MSYSFTDKCRKDLKKLSKKYRSLEKDIKKFCSLLEAVDFQKNKKFAVLHTVKNILVIKGRLFCESLKGDTLRIIFSYDTINKSVIHIEIYFKGDKENEDRDRIKDFLSNFN